MTKTTKPIITIHNTETNEIIERQMNDVEFAQYQIDQTNEQARQAEIKSKAQAKATAQAKLEALGLTVEDLQALGL
jgi:DNA-directed RNA polymerase subunit L